MNLERLKQTSIENLRFSVVDTETTGMSPQFNRIIDIGVVIIENLKIAETWETMIDPQQDLDPWITYYTKIKNEHLTGKPKFMEIENKFSKYVNNSVFVAHNVGFDHSFISNELKRLDRDFNVPKLCTVKLTRKLLPHLENYHLDSVSGYYGIKIKNRHRALPDAYATAQVFLKIIDIAKDRHNVKNFFDLERLQNLYIPKTNDESELFLFDTPFY